MLTRNVALFYPLTQSLVHRSKTACPFFVYLSFLSRIGLFYPIFFIIVWRTKYKKLFLSIMYILSIFFKLLRIFRSYYRILGLNHRYAWPILWIEAKRFVKKEWMFKFSMEAGSKIMQRPNIPIFYMEMIYRNGCEY